MNKMHRNYYTISILTILLLSSFTIDDDDTFSLSIDGKFKNEITGVPIDSIHVIAISNDKTVYNEFTRPNGAFPQLKVQLDSIYTLTFSRKGYLSKKIEIDTRNIPKEERAGKKGVSFDMSMVPDSLIIPCIYSREELENILTTRIRYEPKTGEIEFDRSIITDYKSKISLCRKK